MQVLGRLDVPFFPPAADEELVPKKYVDESIPKHVGNAPQVMRVQVVANGETGPRASIASFRVVLHLDRPAPANCWVQFWRSSNQRRLRKYRTRIGFAQLGFAPLNAGGFTPMPVPVGATRADCGNIPSLFRPAIIKQSPDGNGRGTYSRYYRDIPPAQWNNDLPVWMRSPSGMRRRDVKVILKFSCCLRYHAGPPHNQLIEERSPPSAETLKIQRWRWHYTGHSPVMEWGYHVSMF